MCDDQLSMKSVRPSSRRPLGSGAEEGGRNGTKYDPSESRFCAMRAVKTFVKETGNVGAQYAHWRFDRMGKVLSGPANRDLSE